LVQPQGGHQVEDDRLRKIRKPINAPAKDGWEATGILLRGSICNRKADRPPKPTLINSRTLCKQLAKRHKGSDVSYETMTVSQLGRGWHYCDWASQVARSQSVFGGSHRLPCYQLYPVSTASFSTSNHAALMIAVAQSTGLCNKP
ncbi:hypothetical protein CLIM01_00755, partial [Colletotrichum limetticola]